MPPKARMRRTRPKVKLLGARSWTTTRGLPPAKLAELLQMGMTREQRARLGLPGSKKRKKQ